MPEADRCAGNDPAPVAQAADHDRPERGEQRQRAHRDRVPGRQNRGGPPDPAGGDRCGEERPAAGRDRDREAERAGGEDHERMQLGVGLRDERRRDGVDVPQPLVDDVPDRPDARPGGDEGQPDRASRRRRRPGRPASTAARPAPPAPRRRRTRARSARSRVDAHAYATAATGTDAASSRRPKPLTTLATGRSRAAPGQSLGDRDLGGDDGHQHALRRSAQRGGLLWVARPAGVGLGGHDHERDGAAAAAELEQRLDRPVRAAP